MVTKVLFFDTSSLLKMFVDEQGTKNVRWLTSTKTKVDQSLHFVINNQVCTEFEKKLLQFSLNGKITSIEAEKFLNSFNRHYKNKYFRVIDQSIISNSRAEISVSAVNQQLNLKSGKDDWDGLIYQSIVNALAFLGGQSHPILVTCDVRFGEKVKERGYRVLNPMKQQADEMLAIIQSRAPISTVVDTISQPE